MMKSCARALAQMGTGVFSPQEPGRFSRPAGFAVNFGDHYQVLADYRSHVRLSGQGWMRSGSPGRVDRQSLMLNITHMVFSSDRTVREYAQKIWYIDKTQL
jgi:starch phosphorylase